MKNKNFAGVSLVYGLIREAQDLGTKAYGAEKMGEIRKFRKHLEEAYLKIITAIPLMHDCSLEVRSMIYLIASWYACDLEKYKECQEYINTGSSLNVSKFSEKFKKIQGQLDSKTVKG